MAGTGPGKSPNPGSGPGWSEVLTWPGLAWPGLARHSPARPGPAQPQPDLTTSEVATSSTISMTIRDISMSPP